MDDATGSSPPTARPSTGSTKRHQVQRRVRARRLRLDEGTPAATERAREARRDHAALLGSEDRLGSDSITGVRRHHAIRGRCAGHRGPPRRRRGASPMTHQTTLEQLLDASIPVRGEERPALLCVPETRWVHPLIRAPETRTDDRDLGLALQLLRFVKALDGEPMTLGRARALVADPAALMRAVDLRNRLFESLVDAGVARASCPSCGSEAELVLSDLLSLLRAERWPIADDRMYLAVPSLAHVWARGRRPVGVAVASGVRFVLPSARVGLATVATGGLLGELETEEGIQRELAAWKQWGCGSFRVTRL